MSTLLLAHIFHVSSATINLVVWDCARGGVNTERWRVTVGEASSRLGVLSTSPFFFSVDMFHATDGGFDI
jgi:hypothetical protein